MDEKKCCPFNSKLECQDCRLFALSGVMGDAAPRCVFVLIPEALQRAALAQIGAQRGPSVY